MDAELVMLAKHYNANKSVVKKCLEKTSRKTKLSKEKVIEYISESLAPDLTLGDLPMEMIFEISLKYLPVEDILKFCQTSKSYKSLCDDEGVWAYLLKRDYGIEGVKDPKKEYQRFRNFSQTQKLGVGRGFALMIDRKGTSWVWGYMNEEFLDLTELKEPKIAVQVSCCDLNAGILSNDGLVYDLEKTIKKVKQVEQISVGYKIEGLLTQDGKVMEYISSTDMWGRPSYNLEQVDINGVVEISCGKDHMGAVLKNGDLYMWGSNTWKQIGTRAPKFVKIPKKIPLKPKIISLSCGWDHTGAITDTGDLYMWGRNSSGEIGDGSIKTRSRPKRILQNVKQVSCGRDYTGAILKSGALYMWGEGIHGELGFDTHGGYQTTPFEVAMPEKILQVSCDTWLTGVITKSLKVYLWGFAKWKKSYQTAVAEYWLHHITDL